MTWTQALHRRLDEFRDFLENMPASDAFLTRRLVHEQDVMHLLGVNAMKHLSDVRHRVRHSLVLNGKRDGHLHGIGKMTSSCKWSCFDIS